MGLLRIICLVFVSFFLRFLSAGFDLWKGARAPSARNMSKPKAPIFAANTQDARLKEQVVISRLL